MRPEVLVADVLVGGVKGTSSILHEQQLRGLMLYAVFFRQVVGGILLFLHRDEVRSNLRERSAFPRVLKSFQGRYADPAGLAVLEEQHTVG